MHYTSFAGPIFVNIFDVMQNYMPFVISCCPLNIQHWFLYIFIVLQVKNLFEYYPFKLNDDSVSILEGTDEGLFCWFTVNFLHGKLQRCISYSVQGDTRRILTAAAPDDCTRPPGRPRLTWFMSIQQDLKPRTFLIEAIDMAQKVSE